MLSGTDLDLAAVPVGDAGDCPRPDAVAAGLAARRPVVHLPPESGNRYIAQWPVRNCCIHERGERPTARKLLVPPHHSAEAEAEAEVEEGGSRCRKGDISPFEGPPLGKAEPLSHHQRSHS